MSMQHTAHRTPYTVHRTPHTVHRTPHTVQTSPKSTPDSVTVFPADVAAIVWLVNPAAVAGSSTRQVVSAPVAWSGPMVALIAAAPSSETVTAAPGSQNPQTIAGLGAAARTMPSPCTLANPNGIGGGGGGGFGT